MLNRIFILLTLLFAVSFSVHSHNGSHDRIRQVTHDIEHHPKNPDLRVKRGRMHRDSEQYDLAIQDFKKALSMNPKHQEALYWISEVYTRTHQIPKAKKHLKLLISNSANSPKAHQLLGEIYKKNQQFEESVKHYDLSINVDRKPSPQIFIDRAEAIKQLTSMKPKETTLSVIKSIEQGIEFHGPLINYSSFLIEYLMVQEEYQLALDWFEYLPNAVQNTPKWLNQKAHIYEKQGEKKKAIKAYQQTLSVIDSMTERKKRLKAHESEKTKATLAIQALEAALQS